MTVVDELVPRLAALPGVVVLGGSRARGTHRPDSDWDLGVYYRGSFDARRLRTLGHPGHVEGHIAGLPTYTLVGEVAVSRVLAGSLPAVTYPEALRVGAARRWRWCSAFSLFYAEGHARRGDVTATAGMMARATVQTAHAVAASRAEWVLNDKQLVDGTGLAGAHEVLGACGTDPVAAVAELRRLLDPPRLAELDRASPAG